MRLPLATLPATAVALLLGAAALPSRPALGAGAPASGLEPQDGGRVDPALVGRAAKILADLGGESDPASRADQTAGAALCRLGPGALPILFEALHTGRLPSAQGTGGTMNHLQVEAVTTGLCDFGRRTLVPFLRERAGEPQPVEVQLAILELLGRIGEELEADLAVEVVVSGRQKGAVDRRVGDALRECIVRLLERDGQTYSRVGSLLYDVPVEACGSLVLALKQIGGSPSLQVLTDFLGTRSELDIAVAVSIGAIAQPGLLGVSARGREKLREFLDHPDDQVACAAAVAIGRLEDSEALPALIERLETADGQVLSATHVALKRVSGENLRPDPALWRAWLERAETWYEEELPALEDDLLSGNDDVVARSVREISKHRLHRHELAELILPLLDHAHADVRKLACVALAELGSPEAVPDLVETLDDGDPAVAAGAWEALTSITGRKLPPESTAWKKALADEAVTP